MKRAIVTGATSFLGSELIRKLIKNDYHIYAVIRKNSLKSANLKNSKNTSVVELNMNEYGILDQIIEHPCDIYYSFAWNGTRGANRENTEIQKQNYLDSIDGIKSAMNLGCNRIISAGSQAEYGLYNQLINEETECLPNTEYGKQKYNFYLRAMELCNNEKIAFKEPRFFSVYGPDDNEVTMIMSILKKMVLNQPCELTACVQMWDFLHIRDAVSAVFALTEEVCADGAYNIGSGFSRPLKYFIEEMYRLTESKSNLQFGKVAYPASGMVSIQPDIRKIQSECDWKPQVTFEEGINSIIQTLKRVSV